ncbi:LytR C-terminal domain-containing protein [Marmoricola sp. RAF53]|uniref:LytR C-terminal domain-containing protein n=1 Tax=Marmoricola sp. RAF53 TaxID=3233059 RepID=UPI003F9969C0
MRFTRVRDERGFVLPTRLMVFSISAVALGGLVFIATQNDDADVASNASATSSAHAKPTAKPSQTAAPETPAPDVVVTPTATPKPPPVVKKGQLYVVVFNNSNVKGLAGKTATRAQGAGWNVVGSDNWYGTVDTSTVYYGDKMKAAAQLLAKDLGIKSVKPAVDPMRSDRLTVILTADYQ